MGRAGARQSSEFDVKHDRFTLSGKSYARARNRALLSLFSFRVVSPATLSGVLVFLVFLLESSGCASGEGNAVATKRADSSSSMLFDPADEVFHENGSGAPSGDGSHQQATSAHRPEWSIAVVTVSGADHRSVAVSARKEIVTRFEELDELYVDGVKGGSAVFYGRFESPSDPEFRAAMDQLRAMKLDGGAPAFPRLLPARPLSEDSVAYQPFDLRSLRAQLGSSHPVYTLQIAQWGTFGDEDLDYASYRDRAERHTRALRSQGFTAWFSHNSGKRLSSVNVGVFGADAYDPRSTLFAPEVELLMGQFPTLLVNGEPLMDPRTSKSRRPFLVEVPR